MTIRLLLADDQELVRSALCALLDLEEDFEVVASVGRGDEVTDAAKEHRPDVALLDIEMPGLDGLAAAAVLADQLPSCRVVMLTTFGRAGYLRRAMEAGAVGFVVKDAPAEVLAEAIRRVMAGQRVVDPAACCCDAGNGEFSLTPRETRRAQRGPLRRDGSRDRRQAVPLGGYRPKLPLGRHRQDLRSQPAGRAQGRRRTRLAVGTSFPLASEPGSGWSTRTCCEQRASLPPSTQGVPLRDVQIAARHPDPRTSFCQKRRTGGRFRHRSAS